MRWRSSALRRSRRPSGRGWGAAAMVSRSHHARMVESTPSLEESPARTPDCLTADPIPWLATRDSGLRGRMDAGTTKIAGWGRLPVALGLEVVPEELEAASAGVRLA